MALHRFLADWARENDITFIPEKKADRDEKVAVIGSGPAGLACAYFLAIEGFSVTVFEKQEILGGMLILGIPAYRLPRDIIDEEIAVLRELGVEFKTGVDLGSDATIGQLRDRDTAPFSWPSAPRSANCWASKEKITRVCGPAWTTCCAPTWVRKSTWVTGWPSSAAATWPWMRCAPPCAVAQKSPSSSTAAARRRCRPAPRRSRSAARKASTS
jgi:hypothetical protein